MYAHRDAEAITHTLTALQAQVHQHAFVKKTVEDQLKDVLIVRNTHACTLTAR